MTRPFLGAHWGARAETVDQCADRVAALLNELARIDPLLTGWRAKGRSLREALAQPLVTTEHSDLTARLLAGRNRRDVDNSIIEELGYAVYWWNGRENREGGITLSMRLGVTSDRVDNNVVVNLPEQSRFPDVYGREPAALLITTVISVFQPERAVWSDSALVDEQCEPDQILDNGGIAYGRLIGHPAGWAIYLADSAPTRFDQALIPQSVTVERRDNGTHVIVGDDPRSPALHDVLAVRAAMGYELRRQGQNSAAPVGIGTATSATGDVPTSVPEPQAPAAASRTNTLAGATRVEPGDADEQRSRPESAKPAPPTVDE